MASFFREVRRRNGGLHVANVPVYPWFYSFENGQDAISALQWLFGDNDEEDVDDREQQEDHINMPNCAVCRRRRQAGYHDLCLGCRLYASMGLAIFMVLFSLPIFVFLIFL